MSQYPAPPPSYAAEPRYQKDDAASPLLGSPRANNTAAGPSSGNGFYDQPAEGDLPDDFKYGTTVSDSSAEIRNAFVRKVYSILFCQILATCIVSGVLSQSVNAVFWVQTHMWAFCVPLFGTLVNLGLLYWKRHNHPWNLLLLSTFTLLEAFTLGIAVSSYDNIIVLQALLITLGVFLGLTLFTLQSTYDFSGMGPFLFGTLIAMCAAGLVQIFFPFSGWVEFGYALFGCLLFSGYIVYDTYMINKRFSPDEFIMGAISLYLDFINLFINILRLLNNMQER